MITRLHRVLRALLVVATFCAVVPAVNAQPACLPACSGQTLMTPNFSHQDLTNANFAGATLIGAVFIRANLTGANFNGAIFQGVPTNPAQTPDFTFADLTNATFVGAKFQAPTYFAYATVTCADFSQTDISNGNAVFGDEPLIYATSDTCRTKFQSTTMNCEFIDDWHAFDLTNAIVTACLSQLSGRNFDRALMAGVNLDNAILDGTIFTHANLSQAQLRGASLQCLASTSGGAPQCVDMSNAQLQGAKLDNANLSGASLYNAFLSNNVNGSITEAATLTQAHLRNVNLAFAQLSGVNLALANFYGSTPANNQNGCATTGSNYTGFTAACASAHGATMSGTTLTDTYLYGVDFTNASILGVDFSRAVLAGANFSGATISTDTNGGVTKFIGAYLQGTNLDLATTLSQADLTNAFVDFRAGGNLVSVNLNGPDHNAFACSTPSTCNPATGQNVCVWVRYPVTTVPAANTTITCPNGSSGGSGCGVADPSGGNAAWRSGLVIGSPPDPGPPPGWYSNDATYTSKALNSALCGGLGPRARVLDW